jgi:hypothetical protein
MIEKIRAVQNPLTVIAIFAALSEVASTVALATVDKELQHIFVWFVMAFPTFLVGLFFLTLNFNPKVLYAPSDFRNEENFLNTLIGSKELSVSFDGLTKQLEVAKQRIVAEAVKEVGAAGETERKKFAGIVDRQIDLIKEKVETTKESADELTFEAVMGMMPHSARTAHATPDLAVNTARLAEQWLHRRRPALHRSAATTGGGWEGSFATRSRPLPAAWLYIEDYFCQTNPPKKCVTM